MSGTPWISEPAEFLSLLGLDPAAAPYRVCDPATFPLRVPQSLVDRMRPADWRDPLLLQVLPRGEEEDPAEGFRADAVGDREAEVVPGLLRKYEGRALLLASPTCALNCRFCLRRAFPYQELPHTEARWDEAWAWLRESPDVRELVLSGGDPLMLDNERIASLIERTLAIPHLRTLRIHTRVPVALPSRVDDALLGLLRRAAAARTLVIVIHANHGRELRGDCLPVLRSLRATGAIMLHQMVLLRGINDDADTLAELCSVLVAHGILPYYLHQLDRVQATAHFEVDEERGREIVTELRRRLPGYAVPRYVREAAGAEFKVPLG